MKLELTPTEIEALGMVAALGIAKWPTDRPSTVPALARDALAKLVSASAQHERQIAQTVGSSAAMTTAEAAALHHLSPATVRRMCADGRLPARRAAGGWLIESP